MDTLAEHHLYRVWPFAEDHDLHKLPVFRSYLDFLRIHRVIDSRWRMLDQYTRVAIQAYSCLKWYARCRPTAHPGLALTAQLAE